MTNVELDALDKKLADWALVVQWERFSREGENQFARKTMMPNFTRSLDACFKWLVPKLIEMGSGFDFSSYVGNQFSVACFDPYGRASFMGQAIDKNPALALCGAIEKLIDGVEDYAHIRN